MRIRRSNDDAERDIGAGGDGGLERATIFSFVGNADPHVAVWYDQSGNRHHLRQTDRVRQPRMVKQGVIETDNERRTIQFNNSEQDYFSTVGVVSAVLRAKHDVGGAQSLMGSLGNLKVSHDAYYPVISRDRSGVCEWWLGSVGGHFAIRAPIPGDRLVLWLSTSDGKQRPRLTLRLDGKEVGSLTTGTDALAPTGPTTVGALYWEDKLADFFAGSLGELIVVAPGADLAKLPALTADQQRWWKTP